MKKLIVILFATLSTILFAFTQSQEINGEKYEFHFEKAPQRAVSISHFTTEIMLKLGLKDQMVGTAFLEEEIYPSVAEDYKKVPVLAEKWPSLEQLLAVEPDFVTGWEVAFKKGVDAKMIRKYNINIFVPKSSIDFNADLNTLFDDFMTFGKIFHKEKEVEKYVNSEKDRVEKIKKNVANRKEFTYFLYDSGTDKAFTVFEGFTTNLLSMVHGRNILSGQGVQKTWGETSWEPVIVADPDYFIIVDYSVGIRKETDSDAKIKAIKANPKLKNLKAVKNNKFIRVKLAEICPGIRNVDFFERVAKEVYNINE